MKSLARLLDSWGKISYLLNGEILKPCLWLSNPFQSFHRSDIARAMGRNVKDQLAHPFVTALLADSYAHGNSGAQETCNWARGLIQAATQL